MHAFDVLGDPIRRRILELLREGEMTAGGIVDVVQAEFGVTQAAVSQHLQVLRNAGFAESRPEGAKRIYCLRTEPLIQVDDWLESFRGFWNSKLDALEAELRSKSKERK